MCNWCKLVGHIQKKCWKYQTHLKKKKKEPNGNSSANNQTMRSADTNSIKIGSSSGSTASGIRMCHLQIKNYNFEKDSASICDLIYNREVDLRSMYDLSSNLISLYDLRNDSLKEYNDFDDEVMPLFDVNSTHINRLNVLLNSVQDDDIIATKWYMDSGAGRHMSNNLEACVLFNNATTLAAQTANGENLMVIGTGDYVLKAENDLVKLTDVVYCPDLEASFISVACLDRCGYKINFENGKVKVFDQNGLFMTGELKSNNLYEMNLTNTKKIRIHNLNLSSKPVKDINYWHQALGHVNFGDLVKLDKLNLSKVDASKLICKDCVLAKSTRLPFKRSINRANELLELVHSDLSGIVNISNAKRFNYFITFTDDYSRYSMVYLLHAKNQALTAFEDNQIGERGRFKIKRFRTDGGKEYINHLFSDVLTENEIIKETTCPYSAQQNARAEKYNRTINDMARVMIQSSNLPVHLWPYAILHSAFIKNRLPHSSIDGKVPYELFYNKKAEYKDVKRFGEKVIYISHNRENKFKSRNDYAHFVGYPAGTRRY